PWLLTGDRPPSASPVRSSRRSARDLAAPLVSPGRAAVVGSTERGGDVEPPLVARAGVAVAKEPIALVRPERGAVMDGPRGHRVGAALRLGRDLEQAVGVGPAHVEVELRRIADIAG